MDDKNKAQNQDEYIHDVNESTLLNPFSNAFKNILQKLHLIKSDQKLIGTKETNSKGYQITSKNPLEATDRKSLKAILRNAFESHQQKRAEKIRAKNTANTLPKYTIGKQEQLVDQNQAVKDPNIEVIKPVTVAERAAMRAQQFPTMGTINIDKSIVEDINKTKTDESSFESDSTDGTLADTDIVPEVVQPQSAQNVVVIAETIVTGETETTKDSKSKTSITKRKDEPDQRDL